MAKIGDKIQNICSEVPGEQPLREHSENGTTDNFVPVMTVTKKEAAFTKGDLKLQKVTVTENVSESTLTVLNPLYSEVFGDVISGPQPLRKIERHRYSRERQDSGEGKELAIDLKQAKTRIPILKFKQTVHKVKNGKTRATEEAREHFQESVPVQRTSIPRPTKPNTNPMTTKRDTYARPLSLAHLTVRTATSKAEEEFNKIFDEICTKDILSDDDKSIADKTIILDTTFDDEIVQNSFEEIMNSYNEISNHNGTDANNKSTPETMLTSPKKNNFCENDLMNSLKFTPSLNKETVKVEAIDFSKIRLSNAPIYGKVISLKSNKDDSIKSQNFLNFEGGKMNNSSRENVNVAVVIADKHTKNEVLIDTSKNLNNFSNKTIEYENVQMNENLVDEINIKVDEVNIKVDENETNSRFSENSTKLEVPKLVRKDSFEEDNNILRGKVSMLISRMDSFHDTKDSVDKHFVIDIPKKTSILSKIALFEKKESLQSVKSKESREIKNADTTVKESICRKPKIIEEVLETPIRLNSGDNDQQIVETKVTMNRPTKLDDIRPNQVITQNNSKKIKKIVVDIINTAVKESIEKFKVNEKHLIDLKDTPLKIDIITDIKKEHELGDKIGIEKEILPMKTTVEVDEVKKAEPVEVELIKETTNPREKTIESRKKSLKSISDVNETGLKIKRSQSVIDIELGDTVKGKVQHIIETIKSEKLVSNVPKEVINVKERPRKKSVLEKIALFERKVVPETAEVAPNLPPNESIKINKDGRRFSNYHEDSDQKTEDRIAELKGARVKYGSFVDMPLVELNSGVTMPVLAIGTALLNQGLVQHIVEAAIDLGYRAVDSAYVYGNEQSVGDAIRSKVEDGTVNREDLFIMSKLWSTFHDPELVEQACRNSLNNMGLEYFDLYMIHNPMSFKEGGDLFPTIANVLQYSNFDYLDTWLAMESLITKGLVRSIGLSNFNSQQIARIIEKGTIKPVINQVECHPYLSQKRLSDYCDAHNIVLCSYGALGSKGTPLALKSPGVEAVIDDPLIKVMASALNISPARLLIRYQLERSHAVVVKASTARHLWDNLQALNCTLSSSEVEAINVLNRNKRNFSFKERN